MNPRLTRRTRVLVGMIILISLAVLFRLSLNKIIIGMLVGVAYLSGHLALFLGVISSFLVYLSSLPVITTLLSFVAAVLAKLHFFVFKVFVDRGLRRMAWFNRLELRVKNSPAVERATKAVDSSFRKLVRKDPRRVKFMEINRCPRCGRDVPADGILCPYCGEKIDIEGGSGS